MKRFIKKAAAISLAIGCICSMSLSSFATYATMETITSQVSLNVSQELAINKPSKNITTSSAYYYIMGSSDPNQTLYMGDQGHTISNRGAFGSFGVYVSLVEGDNIIKFTQGSKTVSLTITRSNATTYTKATTITSAFPTNDVAEFVGKTVTLSCVAPAGSSVIATVNGKSYQLTQVAAASEGIAARFTGTYTMPDADGTVSLGKVTYTLNNSSNVQSAGRLYTTGAGNNLTVQCTQVSAGVSNASGTYIATAKLNAVDNVVETNDTMYKLSMGGWVRKTTVQPLEGKYSINNTISYSGFTQENSSEVFTFNSPVSSIAQTWVENQTLYIKLFTTTGNESFSTENSKLFSSGRTYTTQDGATVIALTIRDNATLWGHVVQYRQGYVDVIAKYKPTLSGNANAPLQGITVALDSGHGTADTGALGIKQTSGPTESDINRATAVAVKRYLEAMGATVILPDPIATNSNFNDRMQPAIDYRADVFISLHCNATAENANGVNAKGTEVYYYEQNSKKLAESLQSAIVTQTGRTNRGAKFYEFRVTLNSLAPSVLVEMGFMTNPSDYDDLCSRAGIYKTAVAIGNGLVNLFSA